MIVFGFDNYNTIGEGSHRICVPNTARETGASYGWHHWIPYLAAVDASEYKLESVDRLMADGAVFIFPLELRWEVIEYLATGSDTEFLDPLVPPRVLSAIKSGQATLIVSLAHEGRNFSYTRASDSARRYLYDDVADFVQRNKLRNDQVWVVTGNVSFEPEMCEWLRLRNHINSPFQVRYGDVFCPLLRAIRGAAIDGNRYQVSVDLSSTPAGGWAAHAMSTVRTQERASIQQFYSQTERILRSVLPDKTFLCLNNVPRYHRIITLIIMILDGYIENSLVSLNLKPNVDFNFESDDMRDGWRRLKQRMPLRVDDAPMVDMTTRSDSKVTLESSSTIGIFDDRPYRRVKVNIITETVIDDSLCFLSEKTWKGLLAGRPFVVVGTPRILSFLQSRGYQTFSGLFDESYDACEFFDERMIWIRQTLKLAARLSISEVIGIGTEIFRYNIRRFETQSSDLEKVFREIKSISTSV